MSKERELTVSLTLDEVNTVLEGLGHLPFMKVYRIIEKIHMQATAQNATGLQMPVPPVDRGE